MSSYVNRMKVGDKIQVALPYGRFNYLGLNIVRIKELYFVCYSEMDLPL